jgi:hypothetical protein
MTRTRMAVRSLADAQRVAASAIGVAKRVAARQADKMRFK